MVRARPRVLVGSIARGRRGKSATLLAPHAPNEADQSVDSPPGSESDRPAAHRLTRSGRVERFGFAGHPTYIRISQLDTATKPNVDGARRHGKVRSSMPPHRGHNHQPWAASLDTCRGVPTLRAWEAASHCATRDLTAASSHSRHGYDAGRFSREPALLPIQADALSQASVQLAASEHEPDAMLIRRGLGWKYTAEGLNQLVRVAFAFVLARLLVPEDFGLAGMALTVSSFVLVFSDLALGSAIVQRQRLTEAHISTAFWVCVASGTFFTVVGIAVSGVAAAAFNEPAVRDLFAAMSLSFLITSLGAIQAALLMREMNFKALELRNISGTLAGGAVGVGIAIGGGGAWAIVAQQLTFATVSTVLLWLSTKWRPQLQVSGECLRELGGYSVQVLGNQAAYVGQETTTVLLIGRLLGPTSLGLYTFANNVVLTPIRRISLPLGQILFPAFSRRQDDPERIAEMWLKALALSAAVMLPALAGLAIVAPEFVSLTLGDKWSSLAPLIQILVWMAAVRALQGPTTAVVLAIGRPDLLLKFSIVSFVLACASILIGATWGIEGVAVVMTASAILFSVVWTYLVGRTIGVSFKAYRSALSGILQATIVMVLSTWAVRQVTLTIGNSEALTFLSTVATGALVYCAMCRWRARESFEYLVGVVTQVTARVRHYLGTIRRNNARRTQISDT